METVTAGNYQQTIPGFNALKPTQIEFINEVFRTQDTIPHRFMNADRADPGKGIVTLQDAIEQFLDAQKLPLDELQRRFRFFFIHSQYVKSDDETNCNKQYAGYVEERHQRLAAKYPGVVWVMNELSGAQRVALSALFRDCHGMTGGAQDGFNIVMMETATINAANDTATISGNGTGFALEVERQGFKDAGFFPRAGSAEDFRKAFADIVAAQSAETGILQRQKSGLVNFVKSRKDTLIVDRPE